MVARALQVPTWANPHNGTAFTNVFANVAGLKFDFIANRYEILIHVYVDETAKTNGKRPIDELYYRSKKGGSDSHWDGVFQSLGNRYLNDATFKTDLDNLGDWIFSQLKANDVRFASASDIT